MVNVTAATTIPVALPAAVLAHQGGWDEMLLVAGPIAIVVGLLALARRRVTRAAARHDEPGPRPTGAPAGADRPAPPGQPKLRS